MTEHEQLDLIDVFWERLRAADAPLRRRRRVRNGALVAAAVAALAIPAWATGLLGQPFPRDDAAQPYEHIEAQRGERYLLASGRLDSGDDWSIVAYRAAVPSGEQKPQTYPFHTEPGACVQLRLNRFREPHGGLELFIDCTEPKQLEDPILWLSESIKGRRNLRAGLLPANVALVHVTFASGRHLDIRPNQFDAESLRAGGFRFPFTYLAFLPPAGEVFAGLVAVDDEGQPVGRVGHPTPTPEETRTVSSPAI
jgi:hypothetical protein